MRRIKTQAEINRKKKRNGTILGIVLVGLLIMAPLGYSFLGNTNSSNKVEFNGYKFQKNGAYWTFVVQGQEFVMQFLPISLTDISVSGFYNLQTYVGKTLYFVNLDGNEQAGQEILNSLDRYIGRWQRACLDSGEENLTCGDDIPVKTCEDNLIIFEKGVNNVTSVRKEENCVYISGDLIEGSDAFLYKMLDIL